MIKNIVKNFFIFDITFYSYHRFIHNFNFHLEHHKNPESDEKLIYASCISGITYSTFGYLTNNIKPTLFFWSLATITHPLIHKYELSYFPFSYIQNRHDEHHKNPNKKFGPITPFCDIICGTEY